MRRMTVAVAFLATFAVPASAGTLATALEFKTHVAGPKILGADLRGKAVWFEYFSHSFADGKQERWNALLDLWKTDGGCGSLAIVVSITSANDAESAKWF